VLRIIIICVHFVLLIKSGSYIILIGATFFQGDGGGRVNVSIKGESLNIPTHFLIYTFLETPTNGTLDPTFVLRLSMQCASLSMVMIFP
jgi:hypothetical protein